MSPEPMDALLRRLRWTVLRPLATHLGGDERSLVRGQGLEISELREYQAGDDVRHIDWNVTARADRPYVREAYVERALDVWLLIDVSPSVAWGTAECLKRDRAVELTAAAGSVLGRHGNRLAALLFADAPFGFLAPGAGRPHLLRILASIEHEPARRMHGATDLAAALRRAATLIRRPSLVVLLSDFLVPHGWADSLRRLSARHEVVAFVLRDPREAELPDVGLLTFEDPETGQQLVVDTANRKLRDRFKHAAQAQADALRTELIGAGADHVFVGTDEPLLPAFIRFLAARRARRARRGHLARV